MVRGFTYPVPYSHLRGRPESAARWLTLGLSGLDISVHDKLPLPQHAPAEFVHLC